VLKNSIRGYFNRCWLDSLDALLRLSTLFRKLDPAIFLINQRPEDPIETSQLQVSPSVPKQVYKHRTNNCAHESEPESLQYFFVGSSVQLPPALECKIVQP
jgi:hypothetical protein